MIDEGRRTQALRGPGAGGFTPPQSLAASNPCLNCGTNIQLEYCPECGQGEVDPDPTLREMLHELAEELLHWDGKLLATYRVLLTQPGVLTKEYLAGRRVRYVSPIRVYLVCSVLYFLLAALIPQRTVVDAAGRKLTGGIIQIATPTPVELRGMDAKAQNGPLLQRVFLTHLVRAVQAPERVAAAAMAAVPKAMFVLVPVFAALLAFAYRSRRRHFPQHLAFALHMHAALFVTLTLMLAGRFVTMRLVNVAYQLAVQVVFSVYLVRATRTVYGGTTGDAIARLTLASALYFVAFIIAVAVLLTLSVLAT